MIRRAERDFSQEKNENLKQFQRVTAFSDGGIMRQKPLSGYFMFGFEFFAAPNHVCLLS